LYVSAGSIATKTTQGSVKHLKVFKDRNLGVYTRSFLRSRGISIRSHDSAYSAIREEDENSRHHKHCKTSVEIDWEYFQGIWSRGKQDIGALVKTTVFDEILIRALCSANSSKVMGSHPSTSD
jgi:hypothetical protein